MMNMMNISEIQMLHEEGFNYSAAKVIDLPADTQVTFVETQSRWTGTGYKNEIYRVVGTDDAVVVYRNNYCAGNFYDTVEVKAGYFADRRNYGLLCKEAAKSLGCPVELALAIGPDAVGDFVKKVANLVTEGRQLSKDEAWALTNCGINRRKAAIRAILGDNTAEGMGQVNSERVAQYLADMIPEAPRFESKYCDSEAVSTSLEGVLKAAGF